jgi:hypothetical protein
MDSTTPEVQNETPTVEAKTPVLNPESNQNPAPTTATNPKPIIPTTVASNPTPKDPNRKKKTFKIIVIGDTGVGKTCLTYRFCSGKFPSTPTDATIGVDFREKLITLDNNEQVHFSEFTIQMNFSLHSS